MIVLVACMETSEVVADPNAAFASLPDSYKIVPAIIDEASGIADSRMNPGCIWVEQDSGSPPELSLIDKKGNFVKKIYIKGAENRDWEDMTIAAGPEKDIPYIYVGEIGDNGRRHAQSSFYRFPEPVFAMDTIVKWDRISFVYPDGPRDAEAFLVENNTKDIYIITKTEDQSRIYKLPYPQNIKDSNTAVFVGELSFKGAVSAAISEDGTEIIIKTYKNLYYWKKPNEESISAALARDPVKLGYKKERQGEAICFAKDGSCFYTLSEKPMFASAVSLCCYKRK